MVQQPRARRAPGVLRRLRGRPGRAPLPAAGRGRRGGRGGRAHPAATAYLALFRHGGLRPTETVYVGGAAGNVGTALTSLARFGGARVLAGARPEDAGWCRAAGAAEMVDYRNPELPGRLAALAPDGIDLYVDTSSHLDLPGAVDLLADRGRVVWPLERTAEAHQAVERGLRGRTILRVAPAGS